MMDLTDEVVVVNDHQQPIGKRLKRKLTDIKYYEQKLEEAKSQYIEEKKTAISEADETIQGVNNALGKIGFYKTTDVCGICINAFTVESSVVFMDVCGHYFHLSCVCEYVDSLVDGDIVTCPMCRMVQPDL